MKVNTNPKKIKELLDKNVEEVIDRAHLEKRLMSGQKLRVKFGIDPTSADLHLGHSLPLRKLKQFQELGHKIIFLIGDFTAKIGDPSARIDKRKVLTEEEVKINMRDYIKQAAVILDMKNVEIRYNSEWYEKENASFLMDLSSRFTYARLIERNEFKKRIEKDIDISMLELFYPLLQGYDSVALKADVEIGGTDQKFNLVFARKVQRKYKQSQEDIITLPLLIGTDGVRKMGKSYGNYIKLTEDPFKMFGQIMSIPDLLIWHYFNSLTDFSSKEIDKIKRNVYKTILTPKEVKLKLAKEIVSLYHSKDLAQKSEKEFEKVFKEKELPSIIPSFKVREKKVNVLDLLVEVKLAHSKSEAKRLVLQKGVRINEKVWEDWRKDVKTEKGMVINVGKRKFAKIK